jgi:Flp pilus assembly protein TadD
MILLFLQVVLAGVADDVDGLLRHGQVSEAVAAAEVGVAESSDPALLRAYARALIANKDPMSASVLTDLLFIEPSAENQVLSARWHRRAGESALAMQAVLRALAADADYSPAWTIGGEIHLATGDEVSARKWLEEATFRGDGDPLADLRLTWLDANGEAIVGLAQAHPDVGWLAVSAAQYDADERPARALFVLRNALKTNAADASVHYELGRVLLEYGHHESAASAFRSATALSPSDPAAWYGLGIAETHRRDVTAARHALRRCMAVTNDVAWRGRATQALNQVGF